MDTVFKKNNVIIAHCLTENGGAGNQFSHGKNIYDRIIDVVNSNLTLSCSTIKNGDVFQETDFATLKKNYFGPVGIIFRNTTVTYANSADAGTYVQTHGTREFVEEHHTLPTAVNIENAIVNRGDASYNELCVSKYEIFGLFMSFDDIPALKRHIGSEQKFYTQTNHLGLRYFTMTNGGLHPATFDVTRGFFVGCGNFNAHDIYD